MSHFETFFVIFHVLKLLVSSKLPYSQFIFKGPFNEAASKNKQMLPGGSKEMSDLQAGYFEPHFVRIFEGEGYANLNQVRRKHMMEEAKKNIGKAFLPSNGDKKS